MAVGNSTRTDKSNPDFHFNLLLSLRYLRGEIGLRRFLRNSPPSTARSAKPTLASLEQVEPAPLFFSDIWSAEVYLITIQRNY